MKAHLSLEFIGAGNYDKVKYFESRCDMAGVRHERNIGGNPWVARMYRDRDGRVRPAFLQGKRDYGSANSKCTRGVMLNFVLEENELYWVHELTSWSSHARYHVAVSPDGSVYKLTEKEAQEWLSAL